MTWGRFHDCMGVNWLEIMRATFHSVSVTK